jgi:outer membrane protein TolC
MRDMKRKDSFTGAVSSLVVLAAVLLGGCQQAWINSADSIANRVIEQRQQETLGTTSDYHIGPEQGLQHKPNEMYAFVPHPIDSDVPEAFKRRAETQPTEEIYGTEIEAESKEDEALQEEARPFTLPEALAYAFRHAWDYQTRKEDLYLSALALMTERQLWTPQLTGDVSLQYANYGQERDFDQAMTAVSQVAATQRLPLGGEVAARMINTWMRDIGNHITTGESGQAILEANIPLLKGAGRVAYESRYQAERNLIYAVRTFEAARRDLVVTVAGDFFGLLATKAEIDSAKLALASAVEDRKRIQALLETDRVLPVEADRSEVQVLNVSNSLISAETRYQDALDRFKIRIGMPTTENIDAVDEPLDLYEPDVSEVDAIKTALKYRLDLLNDLDSIDDARRQVLIARNNFLPQFDFTGQVTMSTDPNQKNSMSYNTERTLWQGFLDLEIPFDRREERNSFRSSLIELRRAQRGYEESSDMVRADVRDAFRGLRLARISMEIQEKQVKVNEFREAQARGLLDRGRLQSNRDVIEAQEQLQQARNSYADALANYRLAILTFLRDTGTLRVNDEGKWVR